MTAPLAAPGICQCAGSLRADLPDEAESLRAFGAAHNGEGHAVDSTEGRAWRAPEVVLPGTMPKSYSLLGLAAG